MSIHLGRREVGRIRRARCTISGSIDGQNNAIGANDGNRLRQRMQSVQRQIGYLTIGPDKLFLQLRHLLMRSAFARCSASI